MKKSLVSLLLLLCCQPSVGQQRPNILLLVAEDLSPRIGSYGDRVAMTPNLDQLAQQGVRYTSVFTTAGVCAPSRAALMTGMHQVSFGAQHMRASTRGYLAVPPADVKAFPELMRAAGYYTFTNEKLDYQFSDLFAGTGPFTIWDAEGGGAGWQGRRDSQAFFGLINLLETHESRLRQEWRDGESFRPEEVTDPNTVALEPYYPDIPEVRSDLAHHYDNIRYMDRQVGDILARLEADGLVGNTIVIWTTDHGDALPRAKRDLYDSGIHVPMIVRFPDGHEPGDWEPGTVDDRLVSFVDIAPTILEWAGIPLPDYLHGQNFLKEMRTYIYASRDRIDSVPDRERAIRDSRFKYIRSWYPEQPNGHALQYRDDIAMVGAMRALFAAGQLDETQNLWFEATGPERLFDIETDPHEVVNLAGNAGYEAIRQRMRNALDSRFSEIGDWSQESEDDMRARFLDADGEIRRTAPPQIAAQDDLLYITAEGGASIGYRVDQGPWQLYLEPIPVPSGVIEAKAIRYGWRESPIVRRRID